MCVCVLLSVLKKVKYCNIIWEFFLQKQALSMMNPIFKNKNLFKICTFYESFCTLSSYVCELSCTLSSSLFCCLKRGFFVWWELYYAARQLFHSIHAVIPMCLWWYRDYRITQWGLNSSQKVPILFDSHSQTIISLLDNASNYLVGCVIQKRTAHCE